MHSLSRALYLPHLRASTTIYSQVCELQGSPMIFYFSGYSGTFFPPWSPWSQQLGEHSSYAPTFCPHEAATSPTFCPMIPWSRKTMTATNPCSACPPGSPICQLLLRQLLSHSYALDSSSSKFQIVASRTHDLHKPLRCRIRICVQAANVFAAEFLDSPSSHQPMPPDEFSCLAWTFHRQAHVRQQSALLIFLWRTYSRINLHCRFLPLLAWLPAPLGTVLDSLPKCAPRAPLTLLQVASMPTRHESSIFIYRTE